MSENRAALIAGRRPVPCALRGTEVAVCPWIEDTATARPLAEMGAAEDEHQ